MIINNVDGSKIDTDKLPDAEALIMEKAEELRTICHKYKRQCVILTDAKGLENGGSMSLWNLVTSTVDEDTFRNDVKMQDKVYRNMLAMVNNFVYGITHGKCRVVIIPPTDAA